MRSLWGSYGVPVTLIGGVMINVSTAIVSLRAAAAVFEKSGNLTLQSELLVVHEKLFELVARLSELQDENRELSGKLAKLGELLQLREGFEFRSNAYWKVDGESLEGPFCCTCFDADGKAIRLIQKYAGYGTCGVCKNGVTLTGPLVPPELPQRRVISPGWARGEER
jgi:hypothetical protein